MVTPALIPMSDNTHFRAITGDGMVEKKMEEKPPELGAGAALAPSMEVEVISAAACTFSNMEDEQSPVFQVHSKTESPLKRKGWFS